MPIRFTVAVAACLALSMSGGCAPTTRRAPAMAVKHPRTVTISKPTLLADPDDKATFVQHSGKTVLTELAPVEATVLGRLETQRATYLLLRATHEQELPEAVLASVTDAAGNPLVAAVAGPAAFAQSVAAPEYDLVVQLLGENRSAALTSLQWSSRGTWRSNHWKAGYRQTIKIGRVQDAPIQPELQAQFAEALAYWFEVSAHHEPFAAFAAARLRRRFSKGAVGHSTHPDRAAPGRVELSDLMDFYTGRSAIADSLQTQRGLQLSQTKQLPTEPLASVLPNVTRGEVTSMTSSNGGSAAVLGQSCTGCSPISAYLPADALVIEFATLKDLVQLPNLLDSKLGPLLRVAEASGGSSHLVERYREQLAIGFDGFAETVGQFAVKNAAVVLSDPYLREGTDVTLIFRAENPLLLQGVLESHVQRAKREHQDLQSSQEQIAGQNVLVHATPDGRVRRFEYAFDDYRILSNSRSAMARMIRVKQGAHPRLSQAADYRATRATKPFDPKLERALLYFGTGFVANIVGPRSKILEARRMRARAELLAVDHAALLHGWMEGRRPLNVAELLKSKWLESTDLVHFDGTPITWSPTLGAHSSWGYAQSLVPIAELPLVRVSKDEASAYRAFRRRYEAELSGTLDPTALRFERTGTEADIFTDLSVFPVPLGGRFNSEFRHLTELVGDGRLEPGAPSRGLSVSLAVGEGSPLRELCDSGALGLFGKREVTASLVGEWAEVGLDEGAAVWDLARQTARVPDLSPSDESGSIDQLIPRLPVWGAVQVKSRLLLTAAIATLRTKIDSSEAGFVKWHEDEDYQGIRITRVSVQEDNGDNAVHANVYYAVAKDVFLISLRRDILKTRIDEVLAGQTPHGTRQADNSTQLVLDWAPTAGGWLRQTARAVLDQSAIDAHERACAGLQLLARGWGELPNESTRRRALALRLLGHEPEAPQGGQLQWQNGQCTGGGYGSVVEPFVPDAQGPDLLMHQILSSVGTLRFTLGQRAHQEQLELRARFQLRNAPSRPNQ